MFEAKPVDDSAGKRQRRRHETTRGKDQPGKEKILLHTLSLPNLQHPGPSRSFHYSLALLIG